MMAESGKFPGLCFCFIFKNKEEIIMSEKENRKTYDTWDDKIPREGLKFSERNVVWKVYNADFPYGGNEFMVSDIITIKKDIKDIAEKEIRIVNIYACGRIYYLHNRIQIFFFCLTKLHFLFHFLSLNLGIHLCFCVLYFYLIFLP